jgi:hypothetical protein
MLCKAADGHEPRQSIRERWLGIIGAVSHLQDESLPTRRDTCAGDET